MSNRQQARQNPKILENPNNSKFITIQLLLLLVRDIIIISYSSKLIPHTHCRCSLDTNMHTYTSFMFSHVKVVHFTFNSFISKLHLHSVKNIIYFDLLFFLALSFILALLLYKIYDCIMQMMCK